MNRRVFAIVLCLVSVAACSERERAGPDAASTPDAVTPVDAPAVDAPSVDSGRDAFAIDAFGTDAFAVDAFAVDAFAVDAFSPSDAGHDAFVADDAFVVPDTGPSAGGACTTVDACGPGLWCDFERAFDCGTLGQGTCAVRPAASSCVGALHTVCGCDGNQYFNTCAANAAGTDVQSVGVCP